MKNLFLLFPLLVILGACSSGASTTLPPTPLESFDSPYIVEEVWSKKFGDGASFNFLKLRPAIGGDRGYAADYSGHVYAFELARGRTFWKVNLKLPLSSSPGLYEDMLVLGTSQGEVVALDVKDGKEKWRATVSSEVLSTPRGDGGIIIVRTVDGKVYALEAATGKPRWVYDRRVPVLTLRGTSNPVISNGIVISGFDSGKLAALTLENGTVLWETAIAVPRGRTELERIVDIDADPIVVDETIYTVSYQGRLAAIQIDSGTVLWARDLSSYAGMSVDPYRIYISDAEGTVWAFDRYSGATLWKQDKLSRRLLTRPVLHGQHVVVGDYDAYLHWLRRDDGEIVARRRMISGDIEDFEEPIDIYAAIDLTHSILAPPIALDDSLLSLDRQGKVAVYQLVESDCNWPICF